MDNRAQSKHHKSLLVCCRNCVLPSQAVVDNGNLLESQYHISSQCTDTDSGAFRSITTQPKTEGLITQLSRSLYTDHQTQAYQPLLRELSPFVDAYLTRTNLNAIRLRKESLLDIEDDSDNMDMFIDENPIDRLLSQTKEVTTEDDMVNLCTVDPDLQDPVAMKSLLSKYKRRFRKELTPDAANVKPFELKLKQNST